MIFNVNNAVTNYLHDEFIKAGIIPINVTEVNNVSTFIFNDNENSQAIQAIIDNHNSDEIRLNLAKDKKLIELREACQQDILSGFYSSAKSDGEGESTEKHYTNDYEDQINILGIMNFIYNDADYQVYWKNSEQISAEPWTQEEFKQLFRDSMESKGFKCFRLYGMRQTVLDCETIEEVEAIIW